MITGTFAGRAIGVRVPQQKLKQAFAYFVIPVALFILWETAPELLSGSARIE